MILLLHRLAGGLQPDDACSFFPVARTCVLQQSGTARKLLLLLEIRFRRVIAFKTLKAPLCPRPCISRTHCVLSPPLRTVVVPGLWPPFWNSRNTRSQQPLQLLPFAVRLPIVPNRIGNRSTTHGVFGFPGAPDEAVVHTELLLRPGSLEASTAAGFFRRDEKDGEHGALVGRSGAEGTGADSRLKLVPKGFIYFISCLLLTCTYVICTWCQCRRCRHKLFPLHLHVGRSRRRER